MRGIAPSRVESTESIRLDDTHWPLVMCSFVSTPTADEMDAWLAQMSALNARNERFVLMADVAAGRPDFGHVRRVGAWALANRDNIRAKIAGIAVILESPAQRFLISAFYLLVTPPCPMSAFDDRQSAAAWLREKLIADGLGVPAYLDSSP